MGLPPLWNVSSDWEMVGIGGDLPSSARLDSRGRLSLRRCLRKFSQRFCVRRAGYAAFGDDGGYVFCGSHVEGAVLDLDSVGDHLLARDVRNFSCVALLDGNLAAVWRGEING